VAGTARTNSNPKNTIRWRRGSRDLKDKIKVSLRSIDVYDTTAISQCHGGGGHRNASSFVVEKALFDGWRRG